MHGLSIMNVYQFVFVLLLSSCDFYAVNGPFNTINTLHGSREGIASVPRSFDSFVPDIKS